MKYKLSNGFSQGWNQAVLRITAAPFDMDAAVERVARAIAKAAGDELDKVPVSKSEWNRHRGEFAGRFRDINEPMQQDYRDMASAAIRALLDDQET